MQIQAQQWFSDDLNPAINKDILWVGGTTNRNPLNTCARLSDERNLYLRFGELADEHSIPKSVLELRTTKISGFGELGIPINLSVAHHGRGI